MGMNTDAVQRLYVAYFNRPADPVSMSVYESLLPADRVATQAELQALAEQYFSPSAEYTSLFAGMSNTQIVDQLYQNIFGRGAEVDGLVYWAAELTAGRQTVASIALQLSYSAQGTDAAVVANRIEAANSFTTALDTAEEITGYSGDAAAASARTWLATVGSDDASKDAAIAGVDTAVSNAVEAGKPVVEGQTFALTAGIDEFTGGAGADTFTGNKADGTLHLTALDTLDGAGGDDTLNVTVTAALNTTTIAGLSIANIENANLTSTGAVTTNTVAWSGLEDLTTGSTGNSTITAAGTTDIVATVLNPTGAGAAAIQGGKGVTLTVTDTNAADTASSNTVVVGTTSAAAGAVVVSQTENFVASGDAGASAIATGTIRVDGGTSVNITSNAVAGVGDNAGDINTIGAVTVNGKGTVTDVTVTQTAATAAWAIAGDLQKITNGAVTITDLNTATKTDTITTVTLTNFGAVGITGNALTTVNATGGSTAATGIASGAITISQSASLTTAAPTTLTLNATGKMGAITDTNDQYKTLNINASAALTIADLDFTSVTALNLSGAGLVTISALTALADSSIVANEGGTVITPALAATTSFTGGAGKDTITIAGTTKAITLGDNDDTVTISASALGTGGSVDGGDGNDTLIMTAANAVTASAGTTFEGTISGLEKLSLGAVAATGTVNLANMDDINDVTVAGVAGGQALTLSGAATGVKLSFADATQTATVVTLANNGTTDVANVNLTTADAGSTHASITLTGFETANIASADTGTGAVGTNAITTLVGADLKSIVVTGNANTSIGTFAGTKLTSYDASGATGTTSYTTGALAATATLTGGSAADTINAANATKAVTIDGNGGADQLTGSATAGSTINGGDKNDAITGGAGADTIDGGSGVDTFTFSSAAVAEQAGSGTTVGVVVNLGATAVTQGDVFAALGAYMSSTAPSAASNTTAYLYSNESTTNAVVVDTLSGIESVVGTASKDYVVAGSATSSFDLGGARDHLILGAGVNTVTQSAGDSVAQTAEGVTDAAVAVGETVTFGNGVDVIEGFTAGAGGDQLDIATAGALTAALGTNQTGNTSATSNYYLSGAWNEATGVFTIAANGAGADTIIFKGGAGATFVAADAVILVGVDSDDIIAANII